MSQVFRALTPDGDWMFGQGRGSYLQKSDAIKADIQTALKLFMGEVFWDLGAGVDWWNLLGGKGAATRAAIIVQCRAVINKVEGVSKINKVDASLDAATRKLVVTYDIDTIFTKSVKGSASIA